MARVRATPSSDPAPRPRAGAVRRAAPVAAGLAALAAVLWLVTGGGLVNYDTLFSMAWGRDLALGRGVDLDLPLAPTPHPLATALGAVLTPLTTWERGGVHGTVATDVVLVGAFVSLAVLAWIVYLLGREIGGRWVGLVAAAFLLTRRPFLDFGARAYLDLPYLCLVLGAVLVEVRRPRERAGTVLALLAVAGLLRPEAWLFSAVYVLWRRCWGLLWIAAAAPVLWALHDWIVMGDPLHSLTGTQENAEALGRATGLDEVPTVAPRRLGEIVREPVLLGALLGAALLWRRRRDTARWLLGVGVVALAAFVVLAGSGLPIIGRYLLLPAVVLILLAAAALAGWTTLAREDPLRRAWLAAAAVVAVATLVLAPAQIDRITGLHRALDRQAVIQDDLQELVGSGALAACPGRVAVPNRRPVPLLAIWLDREPSAIGVLGVDDRGATHFLSPASSQVASDYILDPRDLDRTVPAPPAGAGRVAANASWVLDSTCE